MKKKNNTEEIVRAMRSSSGRFFGLKMKSGESLNAQYCYDTPSTVVVYDRNNFKHRRLNKASLKRFGMGEVQISL
jgi:hypothetical protein